MVLTYFKFLLIPVYPSCVCFQFRYLLLTLSVDKFIKIIRFEQLQYHRVHKSATIFNIDIHININLFKSQLYFTRLSYIE